MKPKIRLFPLNSEHIAVSSTFIETAQNNNLFLSLEKPSADLHFSGSRKENHCSRIPTILDNGFYFLEGRSIADAPGQISHYRIENLLSDHHTDVFIRKHNLDISMIAALHDSKSQPTLLGVSKDRKEVYLYKLCPSTGIFYKNFGTDAKSSHPSDNYKLDPLMDELWSPVYIAHNKDEIIAIAGFPQLNQFALATSSGQIMLGKMTEDMKLTLSNLEVTDSAMSGNCKLLSSKLGLLIAHDSIKNTLTIWDLINKNTLLGVYPCPSMHNLNISVDGEFLTAVDGDKESASIHCFELKPFIHHTIKLDAPVEDFAIGKDKKVCFVRYEDKSLRAEDDFLLSFLMSFFDYLDQGVKREYPGTIDQFLIEKKKEIEPSKEPGLLSKMSSLFKSKKGNAATSHLDNDDDDSYQGPDI